MPAILNSSVPVATFTPVNKIGTAIVTANTAKDGTGTVVLCMTAGASGAWADCVRFKPLGTNTASVARLFLNNGSDPTTATNNAMLAEASLPATTLSEVASLVEIEIPINRHLAPSYRIYATIGTTVAAGWIPIGFSGDY